MTASLRAIDDGEDDDRDRWEILANPCAQACTINPSNGGFNYSLTREIGTLRVLLTRIEADIATEPEPERLVLPLTRLVESIARTIRIHSGVTGGPDDPLDEMITRAFRELNLDGPPLPDSPRRNG